MPSLARTLASRSGETIAIIGMGPRGVSVLERIAAYVVNGVVSPDLRLLVVDDVQIGAGRIWRTDQPAHLMMNTVAGEVTMYSGDSDSGPARAGAGPSLHDWLRSQRSDDRRAIGDNDYAPRAVYGHYLRAVYRSILDHLPSATMVEEIRGRVRALGRQADGFSLLMEDGRTFAGIAKAVLATGHPRNRLGLWESRFDAFARQGLGLAYIAGDSAADLPLDSVAGGENVGLIGMGLGFYDVLLSLTEARGGRFESDGCALRYIPSGREPRLFAGSRSGAPILARGANQKPPAHRYMPRYFTAAALAAARDRAARRTGSVRLDFMTDVLPLLEAELRHVYYTTHVRKRRGRAASEDFGERFDARLPPTDPRNEALLRAEGLSAASPLDVFALARPFADRQYRDPTAFRQALIAFLRADLDAADEGNVDGPLKAALDTIRDVRDLVRLAVDFDGLTPESHRNDFLRRFAPVCSFLSAGPPALRVRQTIALLEAGVLEIVGPDCEFACDEAAGRFRLTSPQVACSRRFVTTLIDTRVPAQDLCRDRSTLTQSLLEAGLARNHVSAEDGGPAFVTGGLDVTPASFNVIGVDGKPNPDLFALGIPTEHTRWFTQVGSGRPFARSRFTQDAEGLVRALLNIRQASAAPAAMKEAS